MRAFMSVIKGLVKFAFILILFATVALITLIVDVTYKQYEETKDWENVTYSEALKDIPPFLARNYVNAEDKNAVDLWAKTDIILKEIDDNPELSEERIKEYQSVLEASVREQELYGITSGEITEKNARLQLYLELQTVLASAYTDPDTAALTDITNRLYDINMTLKSPANEFYFEKLRAIAKSYKDYAEFTKTAVSSLGAVSGGILTVKDTVDRNTIANLLAGIQEKNLEQFPAIRDFADKLRSDEWTQIIDHNQTVKIYNTWKAIEQELASVKKSDYYAAGGITTYAQALEAAAADDKITVDVEEKEGYEVDPESPVLMITYNGIPVKEDEYIRHGTKIVIQIDENYSVLAVPEETPAEEPPMVEDTEEPVTENTVEFTPEPDTSIYEESESEPVSEE